jgi:hypothetical protein
LCGAICPKVKPFVAKLLDGLEIFFYLIFVLNMIPWLKLKTNLLFHLLFCLHHDDFFTQAKQIYYLNFENLQSHAISRVSFITKLPPKKTTRKMMNLKCAKTKLHPND